MPTTRGGSHGWERAVYATGEGRGTPSVLVYCMCTATMLRLKLFSSQSVPAILHKKIMQRPERPQVPLLARINRHARLPVKPLIRLADFLLYFFKRVCVSQFSSLSNPVVFFLLFSAWRMDGNRSATILSARVRSR